MYSKDKKEVCIRYEKVGRLFAYLKMMSGTKQPTLDSITLSCLQLYGYPMACDMIKKTLAYVGPVNMNSYNYLVCFTNLNSLHSRGFRSVRVHSHYPTQTHNYTHDYYVQL